MQPLRKYWFMILLLTVPCAYVATILEPSWERPIEKLYLIAWAVLTLHYILGKFESIEGKLDAILKKLNER
jgi:hypothetical protein